MDSKTEDDRSASELPLMGKRFQPIAVLPCEYWQADNATGVSAELAHRAKHPSAR